MTHNIIFKIIKLLHVSDITGPSSGSTLIIVIQGASRETGVFEMVVTKQVEGIEAWVGSN